VHGRGRPGALNALPSTRPRFPIGFRGRLRGEAGVAKSEMAPRGGRVKGGGDSRMSVPLPSERHIYRKR